MSRRSLISALLIVTLSTALVSAQDFRFPEGTYKEGSLKYVNGLAVMTLKGTPEQMGEQAAKLVAEPSKKLIRFPEELISSLATPVGFKLLKPQLYKTSAKLYENFPANNKAEAEAILKNSSLDRDTFLFCNTVFDQKHLLMSLFGCSAVIVEKERSSTGQTIFARNMDYMGLGYLQQYSLITIYQQPGKKAFASIGFPGTIGVISGINDAGLSIASLETTGSPKEAGPAFDPDGIPFLLNYRRILEECSTVEEAYQMLSGMKRATCQHLSVCDKNSGAVLEYTPTKVIKRTGDHGTCRCTNHFISNELKLPVPKNIFTTIDRLAGLDECCAGTHAIGVGEVKKYLNKVHQKEMTLQSMIFEPSTLRVHLAVGTGKEPSSAQEYRVLDLGPMLK